MTKKQHKARVAKRIEKGISKNPADWVGAFRSGGKKIQPRLAQPTARIIGDGLPSLGKKPMTNTARRGNAYEGQVFHSLVSWHEVSIEHNDPWTKSKSRGCKDLGSGVLPWFSFAE